MENEVDTINLPRKEDLLVWLVWLVILIIFLLRDVVKAWKRWAPWIPRQALVLNPFIIHLLSFIDYSRISVYSGSRYQTVKVEAILFKNQVVIDSGRVMMCVLIAYLIPGMARSGSITDGRSLAALACSITFHVVSEFRSDWKVEKRNESLSALAASSEGLDRKNSHLNHYIVAIILISAIIYLLLLLIRAVMIGRPIRKFISQNVPSAISCCTTSCGGPKYEDIKDHVLKCWIVVRLCQPDYVLSRSSLCSMALPTVTACFVFYIINWIYIYNESLNSVTKGTLVLLQFFLARVYYSYMTQDLNKAVIQKCSEWAEKGMEEKIFDVAFLSAKAQGLRDKVVRNDQEHPVEPVTTRIRRGLAQLFHRLRQLIQPSWRRPRPS